MQAGPSWHCPGAQPSALHCSAPYVTRARARFDGDDAAFAACRAQVPERLLAARRTFLAQPPPAVPSATTAELRTAVTGALGLDRLVRDGPVVLTRGAPVDRGDHVEHPLVFEHALVGSFPARLLLPVGVAEPPAILFLPGHLPDLPDPLDDVVELRQGRALARAGFAVLTPSFRAYDAAEHEREAMTALQCVDLHLASMRQVEADIAFDLLAALRSQGRVGARTAVLGHSGGSAHAVLFATRQDVDAVVVDAVADRFLNVEALVGEVQLIDETVPALAPLWPCFHAFPDALAAPDATCTRQGPMPPHLRLPYGFRDEDLPTLLAFLDRSLR